VELELKKIAEDSWLTEIKHYVPSAWLGHAPFMRFLIREFRPEIFVELGTHYGFSYFVACQTVQELNLSTQTFAVDHWIGDPHAGEFDDEVFLSVFETNKKYSNFSSLLKMSFSAARSEIKDGSVDLLHIDGFHTYGAIKEDFETWLPKMSKNGIILLHDIHVRHADFGVFKYWEELKKVFKTIEFTGSYGLGVIFLGTVESKTLVEIVRYSESGQLAQIQGVFGCLSELVFQNSRNHDTALAERDSISNSTIWRIFAPYRRLIRYLSRA
jgi:hypothetical protein